MKRGQAAMEFLMTYGWTIVIGIVTIGVLAYLGVFSSGKYVTGSVVLNPPFYAEAITLHSDGIQIEIRNNGGEDILSRQIDVTGCGSNNTQISVQNSHTFMYRIPCSLEPDSFFRGEVTLTYTKANSDLILTTSGTIAQKVV